MNTVFHLRELIITFILIIGINAVFAQVNHKVSLDQISLTIDPSKHTIGRNESIKIIATLENIATETINVAQIKKGTWSDYEHRDISIELMLRFENEKEEDIEAIAE